MEKVFNKLVRDNIPDIIEKNNEVAVTRILEGKEYLKELYKKLHEECNEVEMAKNKEEITMELADVYEVLLAVMLYNDIKLEEVEASALIKRNKRGGFSKRLYLEKTYDKWISI